MPDGQRRVAQEVLRSMAATGRLVSPRLLSLAHDQRVSLLEVICLLGLDEAQARSEVEQAAAQLAGMVMPPPAETVAIDAREHGAAVVPVPDGVPAPHFRLGERGLPESHHEFTDLDGRVWCHTAHYAKGGSVVWTYRRYQSGGGMWTPKPPDGEWPLYRLVDLRRLAADAPVIICQSERAADAAAQLYPSAWCTTTLRGGQSIKRHLFAPCDGRQVFLFAASRSPTTAEWLESLTQYLPGVRLIDVDQAVSDATGRDAQRGDDACAMLAVLGPTDLGLPPLVPAEKLAARGEHDGGGTAGTKREPRWDDPHVGYQGKGQPTGAQARLIRNRFARYLTAHNLRPDAVNGWLKGELLESEKTDKIIRRCWYDMTSESCVQISEPLVAQLSDLEIDDLRNARRSELIASICPYECNRAAGAEALDAILTALCGKDLEHRDLHRAQLLHFMWQVKRLATGRRSEHETMIVLVGGQGGGKSTFLRKLAAPLKELQISVSHTSLSDDRYQASLGRALIGIWDELAGASKAEIAKVKHAITAEHFDPRTFFTDETRKVRRTVTFIAASNDSLCDVLTDPTGMRRFWELPVLPLADWATINAIDAALIWQAIHHDDPCPLADPGLRERIKEVQDTYRPVDVVAMYLDWELAQGWPVRRRGLADALEGPEIYRSLDRDHGEPIEWYAGRFAMFCLRCAAAPIGPAKLKQRLKQEGFREVRAWRTGSGPRPRTLVPPAHFLGASRPIGAVTIVPPPTGAQMPPPAPEIDRDEMPF